MPPRHSMASEGSPARRLPDCRSLHCSRSDGGPSSASRKRVPSSSTREVGDVGPDRKLAGEFRTIATEQAPHGALGIGRIRQEHADAGGMVRIDPASLHVCTSAERRFAHPLLAPPFQGGELWFPLSTRSRHFSQYPLSTRPGHYARSKQSQVQVTPASRFFCCTDPAERRIRSRMAASSA